MYEAFYDGSRDASMINVFGLPFVKSEVRIRKSCIIAEFLILIITY